MGQHGTVTSALQPIFSPLVTSALETERHVAAAGWDQPPRLFALVRTTGLLAREPHLGSELGQGLEDGLTAIEQEGLVNPTSLESFLAQLAWPQEVDGVALAVERLVVPPEAERDLPDDPDQVAELLAAHPDRKDVRLLVAVLRDGESACLLRQREHDSDDKVASGPDIAPGLVAALAATLRD
ncbi:MAG: PPA1309 family protein [Actinomycetota bacterium]